MTEDFFDSAMHTAKQIDNKKKLPTNIHLDGN